MQSGLALLSATFFKLLDPGSFLHMAPIFPRLWYSTEPADPETSEGPSALALCS